MRCPFRIAAFDRDESCDPRCAWLMLNENEFKACAIAVIAMRTGKQSDKSKNTWIAENEMQVN